MRELFLLRGPWQWEVGDVHSRFGVTDQESVVADRDLVTALFLGFKENCIHVLEGVKVPAINIAICEGSEEVLAIAAEFTVNVGRSGAL